MRMGFHWSLGAVFMFRHQAAEQVTAAPNSMCFCQDLLLFSLFIAKSQFDKWKILPSEDTDKFRRGLGFQRSTESSMLCSYINDGNQRRKKWSDIYVTGSRVGRTVPFDKQRWHNLTDQSRLLHFGLYFPH